LLPGETRAGHIDPADFDTFTFSATSNDVIYMTVLRTNGPGRDPYFYLYDPDGEVISAGGYSALLSYVPNLRLYKTGTYTVGVIDGSLNATYDYLLTLNLAAGEVNQREPGDSPEPLLPGQTRSGHIYPSDYDTFTFSASSNDVLYLTVLRTNGLGNGPYFYLYDPSGEVISAGGYSSLLTYVPNLRLPQTGTYTVGIVDGGLNEAFDYLLTINLAGGGVNQRESDDGPEALLPGQTRSGHIYPSDYDTFTFSASSNDVIYLTVLRTNGPGTGPFFYLYDPSGEVISAGAYSSLLTYVPNLRLTQTGTYTVGVIDGGLDEEFDYTLCVVKIPGPNIPDPGEGSETLSPGETRSAQITAGDLDAFAFHVIAGDTVTLNAYKTGGSGAGIYVQLYGPDGTVVFQASGASSGRIHAPCLAQTGIYTAFVGDSSLTGTLDYALSLIQSPVVPRSSGLNQYLAILQCEGQVTVRWETNSAGFALESIAAVEGATPVDWMASPNWTPVLTPPRIIAEHFYLDEAAINNSSRFYRLRCTNCPSGSLPQ
jgi:hypothetical protein